MGTCSYRQGIWFYMCVRNASKKEAEKLELSMGNNTDVGPLKKDALAKVGFSPHFYVIFAISFLYLMMNKALVCLCSFN
jgi:hypothetical protein